MSPNWRQTYGDWAIVTGASSGIGRAFALALAERGMNVILVARSPASLEQVAATCQTQGVKTQICAVDLTQMEALSTIQAQTAGLEVGLLVNNAGQVARGGFAKLDLNKQLQMVALNCTAPIALTHHFLQPMLERQRGGIITIASIIADYFQPLLATYAATKAFDRRFGDALHWELRQTGVHNLVVLPGFTKTGAYDAAGWQIELDTIPAPFQPQPPERVANLALAALGEQREIWVASPVERLLLTLGRLLPKSLFEPVLGRLFS